MKKILITLFGISGLAYAQIVQDINAVPFYTNQINAGTARYIGMGGSMGALGGDISSIEQNPAGLGVAIVSDINFSLAVDSYRNKTTFGNQFETRDNSVSVPNIGTVFVFENFSDWNRFSLGINFASENLDNWVGMGRNNNINTTLFDNHNNPILYTMDGYHDEVSGHKSKFSMNFGASNNDKFYLGMGMNIHDVRFTNFVVFDEESEGITFRYDLNGTPYRASATGFSFNLGAIGKINETMRVGLAYHSPVWYSRVRESFFAALPSGNNYDYDMFFSEHDRTSNSRLVGSFGMVVGKALALNADYTMSFNGSTRLSPSWSFASTNDFLNRHMNVSSELRLGGEYRIDQFRIRGGYNFVESPFNSVSLNADMGNGSASNRNFNDAFVGNTNRFSLGAGYDFGGFYLDAAYQYQTQKYSYVFGNADYIDYDGSTIWFAEVPSATDNNFVARVNNAKGMFLMTMGWRF